jgi:hypothetical protein
MHWSAYRADAEESIMTLAEWIQLIHLGLWSKRLQSDYLAKAGSYRAEFIQTVHEMGRTGPFWQVG